LAAGTYTVDFYASTDRDGGHVEGERFIGTIANVSAGDSSLIGTLPSITLTPGEYITVVTTDGSGNSSEFSNYAVATRSDSGGTVPNGLQAVATTDGGLSINSDGGNDIVLNADSSPFDGESATTIEVAFSIDAPASDMTTLLSYAQGVNNDELFLGIDSTGELFFRTSSDGSSSTSSITKHLNLFDGERHQVSVSWENVTGIVRFYVDGVEVAARNDYQKTSTIDSGGTLAIGQHQTAQGGSFEANDTLSGTLHDVRVFNDVRTANEIASSYRSVLPYDESGMIANWHFDDYSTDGVVTEAVSGHNLRVGHIVDSGFTASNASLTFNADERANNGTVVGQIAGIDAEREAQIASLLADDPELAYSAETGKFYKTVLSSADWQTATANAATVSLNGEAGQLVTIRSAAEQQFVADKVAAVGSPLWIGASDATVEGEWRWQSSSGDVDQFWQGSETGYNPDGAYENWGAGKPDSGTGNEDGLLLGTDGSWDDSQSTGNYGYIVEWLADTVLDANQTLTYAITTQSVTGAFDINTDTGEILVLDGALLDANTLSTHTLTIEVTDVDSNAHNEQFTIALNDLDELVVVDTVSDVSDGNTSSIVALEANKGADGFISLREAIEATNSQAGQDVIQFNIAGSGTQVIGLGSALPVITDEVFIDGTSQSGWAMQSFIPIVVDGNDGDFAAFVFSSAAANSELRGLVIREISLANSTATEPMPVTVNLMSILV